MIDWHELRRVYVRLPNWVGDVVLATPFLAALRRAAPAAEVLVHGKKAALAVLGAEPTVDRREPVERRGGPAWPLLEGRRLRAAWGTPDLALVLPNSVSAALVAHGTGAPRRAGYALNGRGPLLTDAFPVRKEGIFRPVPMVDYYLGLLEKLGASTEGVLRRPALATTDAARAAAEDFLTRHRLNAAGHRLWALNLGGSWPTKRWIPEYAGELIRLLRQAGVEPILLRGPDEGELARRAQDAAGAPVPGADEVVGLTELTALLARCELLVTTDSGPRHFGVAAGIPVLVVVGPTHPGYTWVDYDATDLLCERVDCWPCHYKRCPVDFRCMRELTPERVRAGGEALLARLRAGRGRAGATFAAGAA